MCRIGVFWKIIIDHNKSDGLKSTMLKMDSFFCIPGVNGIHESVVISGKVIKTNPAADKDI